MRNGRRAARWLAVIVGCALVAGCGSGGGGSARRSARAPSDAAALRSILDVGTPVYCGGPKPYAALTFDDGPGVYTPLALRILREARIEATFFLVGRNLARFPALPRIEAARGALGDHTWTHPLLPALGPAAIDSEVASASAAISHYSGAPVELFRPPYGAHDATVDAVAQRHGLIEVLWSVDSRDSLGADYAQIARNVEAGLRPGAIVLMHENRGQTIRALKFLIVPSLRSRRLRLVTVPRLLALDPPSPAQLRAGPRGCPGAAQPSTAAG